MLTEAQHEQRRVKDRAAYRKRKAATHVLETEAHVLRPVLTAERAEQFVKLVSAGVPPIEVLTMLLPGDLTQIPADVQRHWLDEWLRDPLLTAATSVWNGGAWEDVPEERRVELALAHATNQMAHFLYTHAYHDVFGADLAKWLDARKALQAQVDAKSGTGQSAYDKFLAQILANTAQAGPPQLQGPPSRRRRQEQEKTLFRALNADLIAGSSES